MSVTGGIGQTTCSFKHYLVKYKKNLSVYNTVQERPSHTSKTAQIIFFWDIVIARSHCT